MGQTWYDLLFAHWAVAPEALGPLVPPPLEPLRGVRRSSV
ncbi:MAG: DUF2071 domain-containing protein [Solirubrobacteraceae bacterium]